MNEEKQYIHLLELELENIKKCIPGIKYKEYQRGWNDCEKKMKNFMERHLEKWQ